MDTAVFQALSDPRRLAIVELLAERGELCVCEVSSELGISNALASHHIKKLREAGLMTTHRKGTWLHCRLEAAALASLVDAFQNLSEKAATGSRGLTSDDADGCCARVAVERVTADG